MSLTKKAKRKSPKRTFVRFSKDDLTWWKQSTAALVTVKQTLATVDQQLASFTARRASETFTLDAIADARLAFLGRHGIAPEQRFWIEDDGVARFVTADEYNERVAAALAPAPPSQSAGD